MATCLLATTVAPRKIIKNGLALFERIATKWLNFTFRLSQSGGIALEVRIFADENPTFLKRNWHIKSSELK